MVSESIYAPLIEGPQGPEYLNFPGTGYVTIPAWTPVSEQRVFVTKFRPGAVTGTIQQILFDADGVAPRAALYISATVGQILFKYDDDLSTARYLTGPTVEVGRDYLVTVTATPGRVAMYVDGALVAENTVNPFPISGFGFIGANTGGTENFNGLLYFAKLLDLTPLQGRRAMVGAPGLARVARIPIISIPDGYEAEVWTLRESGSGYNGLVSSSTDACYLFRQQGGAGGNQLAIGGASQESGINDALAGIAGGQAFHIKLRRESGSSSVAVWIDGVRTATNFLQIGPLIFDMIGTASPADTAYFNQPFADLKITDLETGQAWDYANRNDTGNKLRNIADPSGATDGIWYENGVAMTPAAAEVARGRLPMASRHYVTDARGRVRDVLGGTADGTLVGLTAADWQPV